MKVFCSGFNLYGQFFQENLIIEDFIDCLYEGAGSLALGLTYTVTLKGKDILIYGVKNGETHQIRKIGTMGSSVISQTCCTDNRILFLTENGVLYKLDLNNSEEMVPVTCYDTSEGKIVKIACGNKMSVAVSRRGCVFCLPNKLNFRNEDVVDVCVGCEHCLLLDGKGNVYSFGAGSRGQLGHGSLNDEAEPTLVQALSGIKITKIAVGGWHSCALSSEGDLYTWGWNSNGQLGIVDENGEPVSVMALPHVVDFDCLDVNVIDIACGRRHTVALLDDKKLYGCGWNKYHQLGKGIEGTENMYKMTCLHNFLDVNISELKCGPWSTVLITND